MSLERRIRRQIHRRHSPLPDLAQPDKRNQLPALAGTHAPTRNVLVCSCMTECIKRRIVSMDKFQNV